MLVAASASLANPIVQLLVAYCPTDFSGAAAIVNVDALTGKWSIVHPHIRLPSGIFGCVADYDPIFSYDPHNSTDLWLDITEDTGYFVNLNDATGNVTAAFSSDSEFFTGFFNFKLFPQDRSLRGITGTVTESGYCSNGCLGWGIQQTAPRHGYHQAATLPFKAGADDTSYVDASSNTFFFQGSYDLRDRTCGPTQTSQCLISVDTTSGALKNALYTPDWYAYHFHPIPAPSSRSSSNLTSLAFIVGLNNECHTSSRTTNYAFATVNLHTAKATLKSCINTTLVFQTAEWESTFTRDASLFATASGNGDGDDPQFVSLNVSTGKVVVNSKLSGLAKALKADMNLIFVWGVKFL